MSPETIPRTKPQSRLSTLSRLAGVKAKRGDEERFSTSRRNWDGGNPAKEVFFFLARESKWCFDALSVTESKAHKC